MSGRICGCGFCGSAWRGWSRGPLAAAGLVAPGVTAAAAAVAGDASVQVYGWLCLAGLFHTSLRYLSSSCPNGNRHVVRVVVQYNKLMNIASKCTLISMSDKTDATWANYKYDGTNKVQGISVTSFRRMYRKSRTHSFTVIV